MPRYSADEEPMTQDITPTVCLDGIAVRRIREEKKLTQLYVAKVVGVTTDTISRWENNRYPSIKRENALRLAEALEAPLGDLLQADAEVCLLAVATERRRRRLLGVGGALACCLVLAGGYLALSRRGAPESGVKVRRVLPGFAAPGSVIPVQVRVESEGNLKGFIIREHFPEGWKLIEATPPASSLDNEEGMARWIIKAGEGRDVIGYLVRVSSEAPLESRGAFTGEAIVNPDGGNRSAEVTGDLQVAIAPYHWADLDGDQRVDDSEMLQASNTVDEMTGVHLDWDLLENIWDAGAYKWSPELMRFTPLRHAPSGEESVR